MQAVRHNNHLQGWHTVQMYLTHHGKKWQSLKERWFTQRDTRQRERIHSVVGRYSCEAGQTQKQATQRLRAGRVTVGTASQPSCNQSKGNKEELAPSVYYGPSPQCSQKWDGECSRGLLTWQTMPFLWRPHQHHLEIHLFPISKPYIQILPPKIILIFSSL